MEGHINITLRLRDKDVDIRIPKRIEVRRFDTASFPEFFPDFQQRKETWCLPIVHQSSVLALFQSANYLSADDYPQPGTEKLSKLETSLKSDDESSWDDFLPGVVYFVAAILLVSMTVFVSYRISKGEV